MDQSMVDDVDEGDGFDDGSTIYFWNVNVRKNQQERTMHK